ncbi:MAG TPA: M23 family metallopeptidase [Gaiellaceae bacterium]|nr:M23 family metallopeptidase [Gaiellaceae bacterium]
MTRVLAAAGAALALSAALASAAPPPQTAETGATAVLVRIAVPGRDTVALGELSWPTNPGADVQSFRYPDDGSVLSLGRSRANVWAQPGSAAAAQAFAEAIVLSLFNGEIVAAKVSAAASAGASRRTAGATVSLSVVEGLRVLGQDVTGSPGATVPLADWGSLTVLSEDSGSRGGRRPAAQGRVAGLLVSVYRPHGGLPAGSEIVIGSVQATAVAEPERPGGDPDEPQPPPRRPTREDLPQAPEPPSAGESVPGGPVRVAPETTARLTAGGYVFPVAGAASYGDSFGAPRPNVPGGWHHGEDLFAPMGTPVLAVADGTVHTVGFTKIGGYRLWLRDASGNQFYYAHLSAYSPLAVEGRSVEAGDVLGFVGDTGDADGGAPHLHFEIHPAAMAGLGYDGVVAPYPILVAWQRASDLSFSAARVYVAPGAGIATLPAPGAVLLQADDIAATSGLVPGALERALRAKRRP